MLSGNKIENSPLQAVAFFTVSRTYLTASFPATIFPTSITVKQQQQQHSHYS